MMFKWVLFLAGTVFSGASFSADYQSGWNASVFYQAVENCRAVVVTKAANDYFLKASQAGSSAAAANAETIKVLPIFNAIATPQCFCALNEFAKSVPAVNAADDMGRIKQALNTPRCKSELKKSMTDIYGSKVKFRELMLR